MSKLICTLFLCLFLGACNRTPPEATLTPPPEREPKDVIPWEDEQLFIKETLFPSTYVTIEPYGIREIEGFESHRLFVVTDEQNTTYDVLLFGEINEQSYRYRILPWDEYGSLLLN